MKNHLLNHIWPYRIVVAVLGLTVMASVVGAIVLSGQSTPEVCVAVALGSAAIDCFAGLLAPSLIHR